MSGTGKPEPEPEGNTPLDDDEAADLVPTHLVNRDQLNAWEQANITLGLDWIRRRRSRPDVLDFAFLMELHQRMFDKTWRWAGSFRHTAKNIGVPAHQIPEALLNLLADTQFWIEHRTYSTDEIAARFHHRLVSIHPFPNGNGRHARLAIDLLLESLGAQRFSWGSGDLNRDGGPRSTYLRALRRADEGVLSDLIDFVRR